MELILLIGILVFIIALVFGCIYDIISRKLCAYFKVQKFAFISKGCDKINNSIIQNSKKKLIFKSIVIILISMIIEVGFFNFNYIKEIIKDTPDSNIKYDLKNVKLENWDKSGETITSKADPMIIITDVNKDIKTIKIQCKTNKPIPYIDFFYTNTERAEFNGDMLLRIDNVKGNINVYDINQSAKDIRLDLGDNAGLVLTDFALTINPVDFNISISRVTAIVLIYLISSGLFSLQRSPNYEAILIMEEGKV